MRDKKREGRKLTVTLDEDVESDRRGSNNTMANIDNLMTGHKEEDQCTEDEEEARSNINHAMVTIVIRVEGLLEQEDLGKEGCNIVHNKIGNIRISPASKSANNSANNVRREKKKERRLS